ncbi:carboxymuconolactone decarboxylase family protein [Roseinatronobacter sp. S2]|uniref:carboxymuconolactone decarboxylase family protein n=1 Tax=Roseinatronobacter sp. S2 TaxID=3035471 RepID=UPI00241053B0|nr:carboxymuconolactone decarboxylase family protein [Roseinatronobacter sp. S2]MCC5957728.1 carboxymuconolactone decarboxylase family protein [Paracoccaceae bacterium]WFE74285.1 carboxymuconolactone decarboxylase family protein [Roseinatronobacter sp. S2]
MDYPAFIAETRDKSRTLAKAIPDTMKGFGALSMAAKTSGVLGVKEKEFVALGIAVAVRCEPCIAFHVEALMKAGASREELADVLGMCIQMGGGPAVMYAGKAMECWDQLAG